MPVQSTAERSHSIFQKNIRNRRPLLFLLVTGLAFLSHWTHCHGQAFTIFNGTATTCAGALLDSGGQGAGGYSNNENITYTICPDTPGGAISLNWITFNLATNGAAPIDNMTIHDGNSTAAPTMGNWTGNGLQGQVISASASNPSGCLTIVFHSNNTGLGVFAAAITCYQPCERPTAVATHGSAGAQLICPGEAVTFNSSGSFAAPGFGIASRRWDFGDGTILNNAGASVSHTYAEPGAYTAQLYLLDDNGCASTNLVDLVTMVGTPPTFTGTGGTLTGCAGETLCLDGVVTGTTWNELPDTDLGGGIFLPDNVGECFDSQITFTQFAPGQTLNSVNDLLSICINMEHSYMGDLVVNIISPTGESVTMHQQNGGNTFLGIPVDNDNTPNVQGTCFQYCFSPTATNGTWVDNSGGTLPSGTYESLNNLNGLLGSQLNGTWTLQICDLWTSDNGFVCDWSIDFDPSLYDDLIEFTPVYGATCDSSYWTGPDISSTSANCGQACVTPPATGSYDYTFHVTDNFGCDYDTTLAVTIIPGPVVSAGPDASTCNTPVQLGASVVSGGFPTNCTYVLTMYDSANDGWTGILGLGSNNSRVVITVNGVSTSYWLTGGSQGSVNIPVSTGSTISVSYTTGNIYNGEQSYTLFNATGGVLYASPQGPGGGLAWSGVANCPGGAYVYSWSPTAGLSDPNIANPIAAVSGTTQYCVTVHQVGHPDCSSTDCVTITVDQSGDAGTDGSVVLCADAPATALFAALGGTPTAGGTWTAPGGAAHSGNFMPGVDPIGVYTYTVGGAGACGAPVSSTVTVAVSALPNAGTPTSLAVCSSDGAQDLFPLLGGGAMAGGTWSGPSGAFPGTYDPAVHAPGTYTYTVTGMAPCPNATATVAVTEDTPPNAGTDNSIMVCATDAPFPLQGQLGGTPEGGGEWSDPSGAEFTGGFDPAVHMGGIYTYTVLGMGTCPNNEATLTILVNTPADAGTDGSIILCSSDAPADLFAQLGGTPDAGGTWSGPSPVVGGSIDPATMSSGAYVYTVAGTAPCPDVSATVDVTINTPPDPGTDGAIALCITSPPVPLLGQLGGTPDAGGSWSGPSPVIGGLFDPATMTAGDYTYTVIGSAPCPSASATVTVNVVLDPDPGSPGALTLCTSAASVDLFSILTGTPDAGGTWSGPSAVPGGLFDPAADLAGVYTYTIAVPPPCTSVSSTVTITLVQPPDAGTDGSLTLCISGPSASLFAALNGTPDAGGSWSGPSPVIGGLFDPATMTAGDYTYTVIGSAPCPSASATVTVNVVAAPDAGTPGNSTLCASNTPIDLYSELGGTPDAGGSWSGPSAVIGGMFDPATMIGGIYTYTINVPPPCVNVSSTVTVNVVQAPDAGDDGSTTQCISSPTADLFTALGGSPQSSGTWSGPVPIPGGLFDPASMPPGAYTYTVTGTAPCPDDAAVVIVTVVDIPDPGGPGYAMLCRTDDPLDLFQRLEGSPDPGGSWTTPNGTPFNGTFDPAADPGGVYTYTISVPPPCMSVSATVTVDVVEPPDAGGNGMIQLCVSGAPIDLFTILNGTPSANGTWSGPAGVFNGTFDPAVDLAGDHIYTVNGTAPCPAAMAIVTVGLSEASFPGSDATLNLCVSGDPINLFPALGGADPGGAWTGPNGAFQGPFVPGTDPNGTYVYTLASPTPCPAVSAMVNVNVLLDADAGQDGSVTLCSSDGAIDLNNELEGSPDAGGIWLQPSGAPFTGTFDPSMHPAGSYRYVIVVPTPCVNDTALVSVSVVQAVDPGTNGAATLCSNDPPLLLYGELGGAPDIGGTWNGPDGSMEGVFSIGEDTPGAYTYTVPGMAPCPAMSAVVDVAVNTLPDAGSDGTITLCPETAPIQLIDILGGDPMVGGSWTGPGGVPSSGSFDPSTDPPGMYTYTVFGVLPCPDASASATATIFVVAPPDAGPDAVSCDLGYALNATGAWSSGSWSAPVGITFEDASAPTTGVVASSGGAYVLTWSVTSPDGCAAEDTVTVIFTDAIIPIVTVTDAICFAACDGTATVVTNGGNVGTTGYGYEWSGGVAGNVAAASGLCAGTYSIMVLDTNACATTVGFAIDQPVLLVIDRIETTPETCPGSCDGTIVMVDPEGVEYSISGGAPYLPTGTFDGLCPGQYAIAMLDANGCLATGSASIGTPEPVEAGFVFSPDTVFVDDPTVQFTNTSSLNATHFIWDLGGLGTSDAVSPAFTFPGVEGDVYTVCLTAMDVNDCPDTYCAPITVLDILTVHVPNAFTPNDDGFNDGFGPVFNVPWVTDYQFMIFDRWGERIFASEVPEERWDGRYGGEVAKTEVYVWKLQCRDRLSGEFIERMGHVTLLK